jgi:hypothetical protein
VLTGRCRTYALPRDPGGNSNLPDPVLREYRIEVLGLDGEIGHPAPGYQTYILFLDEPGRRNLGGRFVARIKSGRLL